MVWVGCHGLPLAAIPTLVVTGRKLAAPEARDFEMNTDFDVGAKLAAPPRLLGDLKKKQRWLMYSNFAPFEGK